MIAAQRRTPPLSSYTQIMSEALPSRLVLFDIDGTLIDGHGIGGRAVCRAVFETYGVHGELGDYSFHGRTDPAIVRDLAVLWGSPEDRVGPLIFECLRRYTTHLQEEVTFGRIDVLPGVRELVSALAVEPQVLLGLLTGNVEVGARTKLAPTGLWPLFVVAAYGSDSPRRSDLPAVAIARAEYVCGHRFVGKEIVIIGDTPADVACGGHLGVKAVAVATGRHSREELAALGPDHVFADLSDWRAALAVIMA